jgi:hypothetical protein
MTERKSAPKAVYRDVYGAVYGALYGTMCLLGQEVVIVAVRRDVYGTLDESVYEDVGRTLYGAMCETMYSERHEQHTYADAFLLHCQHAE